MDARRHDRVRPSRGKLPPLFTEASRRRKRAKPTRLHLPVVAAGGGRGVVVRLFPRRRAGPPTAVASGALPRPPDSDRAHGAERRSPARLVHVERIAAERRAQAVAFLRPCSARGPAAHDRDPCRPSRAGRSGHGRGISGRVVPLVEQLPAAQTTRPAPRSTQIPLFTSFLEDDFYRRRVESLRRIYTTNTVYRPTVAVGGIVELGRRILREHRDELRPPVFNHAEQASRAALCGIRWVTGAGQAPAPCSAARVRPEHGGGRTTGDGSCGQAPPFDLVGRKRRFRVAGITDPQPPEAAGA